MSKFLKSFRKSLKPVKSATDAVDKIQFLKTAAKVSDIPTIANIFDDVDLKYAVKNHRLSANGINLSSIEPILRRGELSKVVSLLNIKASVRMVDQVGFIKSIGKDIPDIKIKEFSDSLKLAKKINPELDIPASSVKELKSKLSVKGNKVLSNALSLIKASAGATLAVSGVFAVLKIGGDLYENLIDATNKRKGCYLLRTINGVTSSCKINNRSCTDKSLDTENLCSPNLIPESLSFNVALFLLNAINDDDKELSIHIVNTLKIANFKKPFTDDELTTENIDQIISDKNKYMLIINTYSQNFKDVSEPCSLKSNKIEQGIIPPCRACNPSADINSTEYVDTSELAVNITLQCQQNSTILETLVDVATGMGVKIFDTLTGAFPNAKKIFYFLIIFIVLIISCSFIFKNKTNKFNPYNNIFSTNNNQYKRFY